MSLPDSTMVAASAASRTATNRGRSQARRDRRSPDTACSSAALRTGGFISHNPAPASTSEPPTNTAAARLETCVTTITARAGPTMNDSSVDIESIEYAALRCASGTSAASDWRITEKIGIASSPPNRAATSSPWYGRTGTANQNTPAADVVSTSIGRRPRRSTSRPSSGAPTAAPTVNAPPTSPAAPYPRSRPRATCRVRVIPPMVTGRRISSVTRTSGSTPGSASTRR